MGMPVIEPSNVERCDAITDIIQSVALEQAALSHILNAEGEKIQKVVLMKDSTTTDLLETNKSVRRMVETISRLEMILQSKLGLFEDCLCTCEECLPLEDTKLEGIDTTNIKITKKDKNNYTVEALPVNLPAKFSFTTIPNVPVKAIQLQDDMTFEDGILYVDKKLGQVILSAGKEKCAEEINIEFIEI